MGPSVSALLAVLLPAATAVDVSWHRDYATALEAAKAQDKPVLVVFGNGEVQTRETIAKTGELATRFVFVEGDKRTAEGQELFRLFEIDGDHGFVVVERSLQWQFCRFQRQLSREEIEVLLTKTSQAKGKPTDVIELTAIEPEHIQSRASEQSEASYLNSLMQSCST